LVSLVKVLLPIFNKILFLLISFYSLDSKWLRI
jgi:hypothetical protein